MNNNLPPGPFEYMTTAQLDGHHGMGHVYLVDANGRKVGVVWGKPDEKMAMVEMIIDARSKLP